jgi:Serine carboxypeptidase
MDWVQQLSWDGLNTYNNASRQWFVDDATRQVEMYVKANGNFKFYWVLAAGHAVSTATQQ